MLNGIISIHGVPRSGTSWLGQIINSNERIRYKLQPLFSYAFKDRINLNSSMQEVKSYFEELYSTEDDFIDQKVYIKNKINPKFDKSNILQDILATKMNRYHYLIPLLINSFSNLKCVCIIRNPLACLSSFKNAPKEFDPSLNFADEWYFAQSKNNFRPEEYFGFAKWKEFVKLVHEMQKRYHDKIYVIKYEDLCNDPMIETEKLYKFCELEIKQQTIDFIEKSTTNVIDDTYSVFKGKKDLNEWKRNLSSEIIGTVKSELFQTEFEKYLT